MDVSDWPFFKVGRFGFTTFGGKKKVFDFLFVMSSKEVLSKSICLLINQTLETGIFPSEIKLSKIIYFI